MAVKLPVECEFSDGTEALVSAYRGRVYLTIGDDDGAEVSAHEARELAAALLAAADEAERSEGR